MARIFWPLLIIAAVILGLVVSAAGVETRAQIDYLSDIHDHSVQMARNGDALSGVAERLRTIARDELVTVAQGILEDIAEARAFADADPPVDSVIPVRSLFRQALIAWEIGVEGFYVTLLEASDNPLDATVVDDIAAAIAHLRVGDAVYALLLDELERVDYPSPLTPLPGVVMSPTDDGLVVASLRYIEGARSPENTLTIRPGLAVSQLLADPEWQLDANSQVVLTASETVVFSVVLTNDGNIDSGVQVVTVNLRGVDGTVTLELTVEALVPGRQVTLVFEPIEVTPGQSYEVTASIEGEPEDWDFTDNSITVAFVVNSN